MPQYKLTYFDLTGHGEPIRYILSYGGADWEEVRLDFTGAAWSELKPKTPLGQLPILEVEGRVLYQSNAIHRFLAHRFGLLGSTDFEAFDVDATLETIGDLRQVLTKWVMIKDKAEKNASKEETQKKADFYLKKLEDLAKKNGGHLVSRKITVADIVFAGYANMISTLIEKDILADNPSLKALVNEVKNQPAIKTHLAKYPAA